MDHEREHSLTVEMFLLRLGSLAPRVANAVLKAPVIGPSARRALGVTSSEQTPKFASQTFRHGVRHRSARNRDARRVILWVGTYNDYFNPQAAYSALDLLESAGFHVVIPQSTLNCGSEAFRRGHISRGKRQLRKMIRVLREDVRDGVTVVALDPSCVNTFRRELLKTMPNNEDAALLANQTFLLADFLEGEDIIFPPPPEH